MGGNFVLFWFDFILILGTPTTFIAYFLANAAENNWSGVHIKR